MTEVGKPAPEFALQNQDGKTISLSDYRGRKVILYFYPKDDTSGCTKEACSFRDASEQIDATNAVVLGVSADSVASHKKFINKYNLNFDLLSDESKEMLEKYGVWVEKSMYGKKYMGIERTTVLIDENGIITKIYNKVKVDGHAADVLNSL